jgi:hypothetical protein
MYKPLFIIAFLFTLSSCAVLDAPNRIAGFSMQKFEHEQKGRYSQDFELTKKESFDRALLAVKELKARVTHKNYKKGYVTAFDFAKSFDYCLDSTEAAFYIEETGGNLVKITVVCNNSLLAKNLSEKFFVLIQNPPKKEQDEFL